MGSEFLANSQPIKDGGSNITSPNGYTKYIFDCMPYYLSLGMTFDEYMKEDVYLAKSYREAEKIRLKRNNQAMWLQGIYIKEAIVSSFDNKSKYPNAPHPITKEDCKQQEIVDRNIRIENARKLLLQSSKKGE